MLETLGLLLLGWSAGALVNYLADVLPVRRRFARPVCLHCGKHFESTFGYLVWPRRCPHCGKRRKIRTWIVEALFAGLFVWLGNSAQGTSILPFWAGAPLLVYFGVVTVIDMEYRLILHPVSIFGAFLGGLYGLFLNGLNATVLGGLAGYAIMWGLYMLGVLFVKLVRRRRGDMDEVALGFGDVNLTGVLGLILGWPNILVGMMISVLIAGMVSLVLVLGMLVLRRYKAFLAIPYGPFLILGASLLLYGPAMARAILERAGPLFFIGS